MTADTPRPGEDARRDAFRRWFGHSKVVDGRGRPLVVVHATLNDFSEFKLGQGEAQVQGFMFAARENVSGYLWAYLDAVKYQDQLADTRGDHFFMPVFLALQNPKQINTTGTGEWADPHCENAQIARAKREGHDGLILRDDEQETTFYIAFRPEQIKSAVGNSGAFNGRIADICLSAPFESPEPLARPGGQRMR